MRTSARSTSSIVAFPARSRSFARRPLSSFAGHVTCLMLFRHGESATEIEVSDDGDPVGAVWLPKALISIDRTDRGRFLVVTLPQKIAHQHRLYTPIIDRARFTAAERADLEDAIITAARARKRLSGREDALPFPGRNAWA
ncbi:hypothetical protein [Azospirillum sp.]|uniref:hypothetical protein n=1 Tax=Azospirillum sp. TaxID=34012 RepID=UPI002D737FD0|nr:hypothetical protein [Azospirillum sp.]HYD66136.1 hypothetical protein [Azospirillum sp.]